MTLSLSHLGALRGAQVPDLAYLSDIAVAGDRLVTGSAIDGSMALWRIGTDGALTLKGRVAASAVSGSYGLGDIWAGDLGAWSGAIPAGRYDDALALHGFGASGFAATGEWTGAAAGAYSAVLGVEVAGNAWVVGARRGVAGLFIGAAEPGAAPALAAAAFGGLDLAGVTALETANVGGRAFVLAADGMSDGIGLFELAADGTLTARAALSKADGLPIDAPAALAVAEVAGHSYAIVAGSGSSSLSVLRIGADGALVPTDHVLDTRETRFAAPTGLAAFELDGRDIVAAAGNDGGMTLFELGADGRLTTAAIVVDSHATALGGISALAVASGPESAILFAAGQGEGALDRFRVTLGGDGADLPAPDRPDLPQIVAPPLPPPDPAPEPGPDPAPDPGSGLPGPVTHPGTDGADDLVGGAGADVLLDGGGRDRLAGGAGADVFVFVYDRIADAVRDFDPAEDRVDLTLWNGARGMPDLTVTPTGWGAEIRFFEDAIYLASADGAALDAAALADAFIFG